MTKSHKTCKSTCKCTDHKDLKALKCLLKSKFPCSQVIPITSVPFTISTPGRYCLTQDLTYTGTGIPFPFNNAITISTNNVFIDLNGHTLTINGVNNPSAINVRSFSNVVVENGTINGLSTSFGILAFNGSNIWIHKIIFDTVDSVNLADSNNISIRKCVFQNITANGNSAVAAFSCNNGTIEDCNFINNNDSLPGEESFPIFFGYNTASNPIPCQNWIIKNSNLLDTQISAYVINGLLIENITDTVTDPNFDFSIAQFGFGVDQNGVDNLANDVIIRNSTFIARNSGAALGFDGVLVIAGNNLLLENLSVDMNAPPAAEAGYFNNASIHIGFPLAFAPSAFVNGVKINNVVINNTPNIGITLDEGVSGASVNNAVVTGSQTFDVYILGSNNVVKNSDISGSQGNGIDVGPGATNNVILTNNITGNVGAGILFESTVSNNLAKDNNVIGNGAGIIDADGTNFLVNNTEFNNANPLFPDPPSKNRKANVNKKRGHKKSKTPRFL